MARTLCFLQFAVACGAFAWQAPVLADTPGMDAPAVDAGRIALDWKDVPRWSDVIARAASEGAADRRRECDADGAMDLPACRFAAWQAGLRDLRDRPAFERIAAVQSAVNRLPYVSDLQNWQMADRWATPAEMFARGGDCEDYALTKYFALRDLGFAEAAMKLAIVWDNRDDEQHAVLFVRSEGAVWLLDNKFETPMPADLFAARYRVIYALNNEGASFSPSALGARAGQGPRLAAGGRMLVFRTRPVRRGDDAGVPQFAALAPRPATPAFAKVEPAAAVQLPPALAIATVAPALPAWARAFGAQPRLRAVRFWFAEDAPRDAALGTSLAPFSAGLVVADISRLTSISG